MEIISKVATGEFGKIHAVIAHWTGATLCGIGIKRHHMKEYDKPITCQRCLKLIAQSQQGANIVATIQSACDKQGCHKPAKTIPYYPQGIDFD